MDWREADRKGRQHDIAQDDQRSPYQRDHDRILYSSAFRRLSGITQIVRVGEADVFHTRQQHTIKVAQVGRRIAEICIKRAAEQGSYVALDADVVAAACLAHDLGHPPFGHIAEAQLDRMVMLYGDGDGYEGNAQTFRILTRLAVRHQRCPGLDLTQATLAACLKYPWLRDRGDAIKSRKWGAYGADGESFKFARRGLLGEVRTVEAEIMDWADDIAYSVHDLEDFHRCGVLPWDIMLTEQPSEDIITNAIRFWHDKPAGAPAQLRNAFRRLRKLLHELFEQLMTEPYCGTRSQRAQLRTLTSTLIARYLPALKVVAQPEANRALVEIDPAMEAEVRVLKQITRDYITSRPALIAQQKGQQRIVADLFRIIVRETKTKPPAYLPVRLAEQWEATMSPARFAADCVASLTEAEAVGLHGRLTGSNGGSVLDPIVR